MEYYWLNKKKFCFSEFQYESEELAVKSVTLSDYVTEEEDEEGEKILR